MPWTAFSIPYNPPYDQLGLLLIPFIISFDRKYVAISRDRKTKKKAGVFDKLFPI